MIRDITIGQYYPAESEIHKMDPRTKLAATAVYIISLFAFKSVVGYLIAGAFLALVIKFSKVPFSYIVKGLKPIVFLLLFTAGFNLFLTPGQNVLFQAGFLKVTMEGVETAVFMAVRLILLIIGSSLMTFTTTPNRLTDGLEHVMSPLKKFGMPVHEISMMMSIALRFIPILLEETDKIMKAQTARGADFESGGLIQKAKSLIPLLVPLFISAFRRANDLAMAMEARCYHGGEGRTKMMLLQYKARDKKAYLVLAGYVALLWAVVTFIPF